MTKQLLASKVIFTDSENAIPESVDVPTSVTGFIGVAEKGPIGVATKTVSWDDWVQTFGGFVSSLAEAVFCYYASGGVELHTIRTAHYTDITSASSHTALASTGSIMESIVGSSEAKSDASLSEPYGLTTGDTLDIQEGGGATQTATFTATKAVMTAGATPFAINVGDVVDVQVNGGITQTATFGVLDMATPGALTLEEVANVLNRDLAGIGAYRGGATVDVATDHLGSDATLQVMGGTAAVALGFPAGLISSVGSNVADISGVTIAEIKTIVEAAVGAVVVNTLTGDKPQIATVATGSTETIQVMATSINADSIIGFDNLVHIGIDTGAQIIADVVASTPGTYGDKVACEVKDASSGVTTEFNLEVLFNGVVVERYANLTMVITADRYAITIVNGESNYIELTDTAVGNRPTNMLNTLLTGGDDGLVGLVDQDYIGDPSAQNGIYAWNTVQYLNILGVPGVTTPAVHVALVNYCSITRDELPMAIVAAPEGSDAQEAEVYIETTSGLLGLTTSGAAFWPWPKITNLSTTVYGSEDLITVPVDGIVAGAFATNDSREPGGVYDAPAGLLHGKLPLVRGVDSEDAYEEPKRDIVYPKRINPIWKDKGTPFIIDGHRTLQNHDKYGDIQQRRGASHIISEMNKLLNYFKHLQPSKETREEAYRILDKYLKGETALNAFEFTDPAEAYSIDVGAGLNTPAEGRAGKLWVEVGFRMAGAIDWVIVKLSKNVVATT